MTHMEIEAEFQKSWMAEAMLDVRFMGLEKRDGSLLKVRLKPAPKPVPVVKPVFSVLAKHPVRTAKEHRRWVKMRAEMAASGLDVFNGLAIPAGEGVAKRGRPAKVAAPVKPIETPTVNDADVLMVLRLMSAGNKQGSIHEKTKSVEEDV